MTTTTLHEATVVQLPVATGVAPADVEGRASTRLLLTVAEAAAQLGIGRTLMYELISAGAIESLHVGRLHRVPADALVEFVARERARARSSAS